MSGRSNQVGRGEGVIYQGRGRDGEKSQDLRQWARRNGKDKLREAAKFRP